jgi:hypothetical protein
VVAGQAEITGWQYVASDAAIGTIPRSGGSGAASWSGVIVASGTVRVTVGMQVLTRTVQVQARDFTTPTPSAEPTQNGTTCLAGTLSLPVPVVNGPQTLGAFCLEHLGQFIANSVGEGPNAGVKWWVERMVADDPVRWRYRWLINPDLDDVTCPFYAQQTGTYDPVADQTGWISGANLKANAIRHESGPTASHYAQFVAANASGNPGAGVEGELGEPSLDLRGLQQNLWVASGSGS